jgi:hypothetical protein
MDPSSRAAALYASLEVSARSGISSGVSQRTFPSRHSGTGFSGPFVGSQRIAHGPGQRFLDDVHVLNTLFRRIGSIKFAHDRPPRSSARAIGWRLPARAHRVPMLPAAAGPHASCRTSAKSRQGASRSGRNFAVPGRIGDARFLRGHRDRRPAPGRPRDPTARGALRTMARSRFWRPSPTDGSQGAIWTWRSSRSRRREYCRPDP